VELFRGAIATARKARSALAVVAAVILVITILLLFFFVRSIQTQLERVCP
jgi:ABC-type phosphate transport system permease subunit